MGGWTEDGDGLPVGSSVPLDGETVLARVRRSGRLERLEGYEGIGGELAERLRARGYRASVAAPVRVAGRVWGALVASARDPRDLDEGAERRLCDVAELVAQALANADAREMLAASRARIVEAGDAERRRLERNLHDGAQQRLVALALQLRLVRAPRQRSSGARGAARRAITELREALEELRELARGIHPAVLTEYGLEPAVAALAARSPVPVEIAAMPDERLPPPVEAAAYYIIAEAITNVAKYAAASTSRPVDQSPTARAWRSTTTASAAPTPPPAPACGVSPTASRRSTAACRSSARSGSAPRCAPRSRGRRKACHRAGELRRAVSRGGSSPVPGRTAPGTNRCSGSGGQRASAVATVGGGDVGDELGMLTGRVRKPGSWRRHDPAADLTEADAPPGRTRGGAGEDDIVAVEQEGPLLAVDGDRFTAAPGELDERASLVPSRGLRSCPRRTGRRCAPTLR